jgi:hypothetical protein
MKLAIPGLILVSLLLAAEPVAAQELKEFACGRSMAKDGGPSQPVMDTSLRVMEQTRANAKFDAGTPPPGYAIRLIFCARSEIVPAPSDYKVVVAGYPLMIFTRDEEGRSGRTA